MLFPKKAGWGYECIPSHGESRPHRLQGGMAADKDPPFSLVRVLALVLLAPVCLVLLVSLLRFSNERIIASDLGEGIVYSSVTTGPVKVYQSSLAGDRMLEMTPSLFADRGVYIDSISFDNRYTCADSGTKTDSVDAVDCQTASSEGAAVSVDTSRTYQRVIGFGGAFTEAAAVNFYKLPIPVQREVIELYFGSSGIGYSMGRIHINSCDFCLQSYSFDDVPGDYELNHFDMAVTHDQTAILPLIRSAIAARNQGGSEGNDGIRIVASPWSPPAWMKVPRMAPDVSASNGSAAAVVETLQQSMLGSASPNGLQADVIVQRTWANYISRFVEAYNQQGVPIWAVTPQNEPEFAAPWEACAYTPQYEQEFIAEHLGPVLKADHPELLILAFDHNKDHLPIWADTLLGNTSTVTNAANSAQFVDGMAFHWYSGSGDRLMDGTYGYNSVRSTHDKYPDKILLATEGCSCPGVQLGSWLRGERLGHDIMFDLNNWANGWIDWNLLVDSEGGPNHLNNYCDAPVVASANFSYVYVQPKYYFMGHFSKFLPSGTLRSNSLVVGNFKDASDNPNLQSGVELGLFPCEESSRQQWTLLPGGELTLTVPSIPDIELSNESFRLCVAEGDADRPFLRVRACTTEIPKEGPTTFKLMNVSSLKGTSLLKAQKPSVGCLGVVDAEKNEDGIANGLLQLVKCDTNDKSQLWKINSYDIASNSVHLISALSWLSGRSTSASSVDSCLTAGWPFLTGASFLSADHEKTTVIIMNESPHTVGYALIDIKQNQKISLGINGRSIQTVLY